MDKIKIHFMDGTNAEIAATDWDKLNLNDKIFTVEKNNNVIFAAPFENLAYYRILPQEGEKNGC